MQSSVLDPLGVAHRVGSYSGALIFVGAHPVGDRAKRRHGDAQRCVAAKQLPSGATMDANTCDSLRSTGYIALHRK